MREGNCSFTAQGRASVCITAQLYDRRALDATSALPLHNSLTHLTYLTSTSPRIREILTLDGGLECLVRMLRDFCSAPPPPLNPRHFYGLIPSGQALRRGTPTPGAFPPFDRAAAHRFSLAFQCVVNVGVRGSEAIRSRVVQAGMLQVVGAVLEAWLIAKGFAIGPSSTGSGVPRESRLARHARKNEARQEEAGRRQRDPTVIQAADLSRALQRQVNAETRRTDRSAVVEEPEDDEEGVEILAPGVSSRDTLPPRPSSSSSEVFSTETSSVTTPIRSNTPDHVESRERSGTILSRRLADSLPASASRSRRGSSIRRVGRPEVDVEETEMDDTDNSDLLGGPPNVPAQDVAVVETTMDPRINIFADGGMGDFDVDLGVDQALVNLDPNDDLAMGAPPGAPGATQQLEGGTPRPPTVDVTPRAGFSVLVGDSIPGGRINSLSSPMDRTAARPLNIGRADTLPISPEITGPADAGNRLPRHTVPVLNINGLSMSPSSFSETNQGPYKDEDVLLSLQLLAYISKYPYVRQAFYKPRPDPTQSRTAGSSSDGNPSSRPLPNIFSLVERFTFRPSPSEPHLPRLPGEIQYWAGVIMRNACRKDESRGGIRQCASMTCGKWEKFPREFAKCRRCRKAKYCGKDCQSRAWAEGHRFWCSAREPEDDSATAAADPSRSASASTESVVNRRHHHHHHRVNANETLAVPTAAAPGRVPPQRTPAPAPPGPTITPTPITSLPHQRTPRANIPPVPNNYPHRQYHRTLLAPSTSPAEQNQLPQGLVLRLNPNTTRIRHSQTSPAVSISPRTATPRTITTLMRDEPMEVDEDARVNRTRMGAERAASVRRSTAPPSSDTVLSPSSNTARVVPRASSPSSPTATRQATSPFRWTGAPSMSSNGSPGSSGVREAWQWSGSSAGTIGRTGGDEAGSGEDVVMG